MILSPFITSSKGQEVPITDFRLQLTLQSMFMHLFQVLNISLEAFFPKLCGLISPLFLVIFVSLCLFDTIIHLDELIMYKIKFVTR